MKKSSVVTVVACVLAGIFVAGCQTTKGPSDEEQITSVITKLKDAVLAKNIDGIMAAISENFYHPEAGDKAALKEMAQQGLEMIDVSTAKVDLSQMQIKIEGDTATAYPITASADPGSATVSVTLKKEKAGWLITGGEAEGV